MDHRNITDQPNSIFLELSMALRPYFPTLQIMHSWRDVCDLNFRSNGTYLFSISTTLINLLNHFIHSINIKRNSKTTTSPQI